MSGHVNPSQGLDDLNDEPDLYLGCYFSKHNPQRYEGAKYARPCCDPFTFKTIQELNQHVDRCHWDRYRCRLCMKSITSKKGEEDDAQNGKGNGRQPNKLKKAPKKHDCDEKEKKEVRENCHRYSELMTDTQAAAWEDRPKFKDLVKLGNRRQQWTYFYRLLHAGVNLIPQPWYDFFTPTHRIPSSQTSHTYQTLGNAQRTVMQVPDQSVVPNSERDPPRNHSKRQLSTSPPGDRPTYANVLRKSCRSKSPAPRDSFIPGYTVDIISRPPASRHPAPSHPTTSAITSPPASGPGWDLSNPRHPSRSPERKKYKSDPLLATLPGPDSGYYTRSHTTRSQTKESVASMPNLKAGKPTWSYNSEQQVLSPRMPEPQHSAFSMGSDDPDFSDLGLGSTFGDDPRSSADKLMASLPGAQGQHDISLAHLISDLDGAEVDLSAADKLGEYEASSISVTNAANDSAAAGYKNAFQDSEASQEDHYFRDACPPESPRSGGGGGGGFPQYGGISAYENESW